MNKRQKKKLAKDFTRKMKKLSFKKGNVIIFEVDRNIIPVYELAAQYDVMLDIAEKYGCALLGISKGINIKVEEREENESNCEV